MKKKQQKKEYYYDIAKTIKDYPKAKYVMAFGERSNGKTYSALHYALERYFKYGEQFAYIRRFGEDIRAKHMQELFTSIVKNGVIRELSGEIFQTVIFKSGKFTLISYDDDGEVLVKDQKPVGFTFDLNSMEHSKSMSFPDVTTIIFDEFMSRQGYLNNEFVLFMNILSTIIRDRDNVKILMLANTVNRFCPYFTEMGLSHVKDQKIGTVDVYNYADTGLSVVVEYCDPISQRGGKKSDVYFAFDNPQLKMITSGSWEIAIYPHLEHKYRPKDVVANFFLDFDRNLLHGEIVITDSTYFLFMHDKTTPIKDEDTDIVYTNVPNQKHNYRVGILNQRDSLSAFIARLIRENRVFYSNNEVGEVLRNYIMWSVNYASIKGGK